MDKKFWGVLGVIAIVIVGAIWISGSNNATTDVGNTKPTEHVEGKGKKNITLVEYGDYQCPVCAAYHPVVKEVAKQFSADIKFQFRNLPLSSNHKNAFVAARAAEAAGLQNKFWEMHNLLYTNQTTWAQIGNPQPLFESYATQLSLDVAKFKQDLVSEQINKVINADINEFNKTKQEMGTPTFFLNGTYIPNGQLVDAQKMPSYQKFSDLIKAEIAKQK